MYSVNEIFYSLQGEGAWTGTPALFLRFSRCNLNCAVATHGFDCDTDFSFGEELEAAEIVSRLQATSSSCRHLVVTGGEPLLQLDSELVVRLKELAYFIAVETNGTVEPDSKVLEALDWICCSPKVSEDKIKLSYCDELKYVRTLGQPIPKPKLVAKVRYISPAFSGMELDPEVLNWCVKLVKANPGWRLCTQQHKYWGIR